MTETKLAGCCDFAEEYRINAHPAFRALERKVLGCGIGGTSWTTREQADRIAGALRLREGLRMLDLGSGTGWPALYVAGRAAFDLTLLDVPFNALARARQLAGEQGIVASVDIVCASAALLPFAAASFAALGHSDVLCCLPEKQEMLDECRRVARAGARMLFWVIAVAPGLAAADREEALAVGPSHVHSEADYPAMLDASGWQVLEREDATPEFLESLQRMVAALAEEAGTFRNVLGADRFEETLQLRRSQVAAVQRGLLSRELYLAGAV